MAESTRLPPIKAGHTRQSQKLAGARSPVPLSENKDGKQQREGEKRKEKEKKKKQEKNGKRKQRGSESQLSQVGQMNQMLSRGNLFSLCALVLPRCRHQEYASGVTAPLSRSGISPGEMCESGG